MDRSLNLKRKIVAALRREKYVPYANRPGRHALSLASKDYARRYELALRYLLRSFNAIRSEHGVEVLFVLGPWHYASFNHPDILSKSKLLRIEKEKSYLAGLLADVSLPFCDPTHEFADDYKLNGKRFDFLYDGHFNKRGHKVMGEAIAACLIREGWVQ